MPGIGGSVSDLLDLMALVDNELQVGEDGRQETRAILALREAQHYFETLAAVYPDILQDTITVGATANTETTDWATGLLRIDGMQYLDANGVPVGQMYRIDEVGGHVPSLPLPIQLLYAPTIGGAPFAYYGNGRDFYWLPQPDTAYSFRIYGLLEADEFTDRDDDFDYPKRTRLAFATFAAKLLQVSTDDDPTDMDELARQVFTPLIKQLRTFDRSAPRSRHYTEFHTT